MRMRSPRRLARHAPLGKVTGRSRLARELVLRNGEREQWRFVSVVPD
jgi:hypothetical protein